MRAIIINDENTDDQAKGGTGKGIFYQALNKFMPGVKENGKAYRPNRAFSFQNINIDTRIVFIDDVPAYFDITMLFSVISDGLFVEKKNMAPIWIDAVDAPVFLISTNYGLSGDDDSSLRRRYDIGLDKYYDAQKTPETEFGHQLFREWPPDSVEWIKFDLFMLESANMYVNNAVKTWKNPKLDNKQFNANTHIDFMEFAEAYYLNVDISKPETLKQLRELTNKPNLSTTKMTQWNKKYAKHKKYEYTDNRKNKTFMLTKQLF